MANPFDPFDDAGDSSPPIAGLAPRAAKGDRLVPSRRAGLGDAGMWPGKRVSEPPSGFVVDKPNPFDQFDPDKYLEDAPWLKDPVSYGTGESALEGYLKGASANWRDEIYGASEASGLPKILGGLRAPIGAARLAYERYTQPNNNLSSLITGDARGPVQKEYERARDEKRRIAEEMQKQNPTAFGAGELGGAAATMLAAPQLRASTALGRVGAGMATGAGYGALAGAGEAETPQDILSEATRGAAAGTLFGGAGSAVGEAMTPLVTPIWRKASSLYHGLADPEAEAIRRYLQAAERDRVSAGERLTPQDIQLAQHVGMPIGLIDTSGQAVRELGRTAANFSPEAQAALKQFTQDRFEEQSPRIAGFIRQITGGADSTADAAAIEAAARKANKPAYKVAYQAGDAGIWTPELERLAGAPAVRQAMQGAVERGQNRAIMEGFGAFNPGVTFENGMMRFGQGKGAPPYPNMQFWDYVQRELRDMGAVAQRSGRNEEAGALKGLHKQLLGELDSAVPEFQSARRGAASYFGADNALEAGSNFVRPPASMTPKDMLAQQRAFKSMNAGEQELFARGYASRLAHEVERAGDNRDVLLKDFFNSQAGRARTRIALGPGRAQQLEALLRVESIVDQSRKALGNSTTARQMIAAAAFGAGGDYAMEGHFHPSNMLIGALAGASFPHAYQQVGQLVSRRVATQLGKLLTSNNPADLAKGAKIASRDAAVMNRLRQLTRGTITGVGTEAVETRDRNSFDPDRYLSGRAAGGAAHRPDDEDFRADLQRAGLSISPRASGGGAVARRVPGELPEAKKASHAEVGYVDESTRRQQNCALCTKFIYHADEAPRCKRVKSPIVGAGWCRRFVRDPEVR